MTGFKERKLDLAAFYHVVSSRRDVRAEFIDEAVDPNVLLRVLSAAHAAPSVGMSQPWDFILIDSPRIKDEFYNHVVAEREVFARKLTVERQEIFTPIKIEGIKEAALGVVVTYDPSRGGNRILGRNTVDETGIFSACLAIENLWLAATAEGYGVGWVSFYREEFLANLLGVDSPVRPIAWLCFGPVSHLEGIPDLERFGWRSRRPLADAVYWNSFTEQDSKYFGQMGSIDIERAFHGI